MPDALTIDAATLDRIRSRADRLDLSGAWHADDLADLTEVGAMRWAIDTSFGGENLSALDLHLRYEAIAEASLAAALVVSQRDSAVGFVEACGDWPDRDDVLGRFARNEIFSTIGIAQLTTSRQQGPPALVAKASAEGFRVNGVIPWATGAGMSDFVVAAAAIDTGGQILFQLPTSAGGVTVGPPLPLVALRSTWTCQIVCDDVAILKTRVLRGPTDNALAGRSRSLPLGQAFLATGLCRGGLKLIAARGGASARSAHETFQQQLASLRTKILELSQPDRDRDAADASPQVRGACNDLAMRIGHTAVALYKGSALMAGHPAQRLAREAMFLLVWSCPNPVLDCTIDLLAGKR